MNLSEAISNGTSTFLPVSSGAEDFYQSILESINRSIPTTNISPDVPKMMIPDASSKCAPSLLRSVSSGVDYGNDGKTNTGNVQPELRGEVVAHPYMSLYYPLLTSSESHELIVHPKGIRTSSLQKRPVEYTTRIYDVVSAEKPKTNPTPKTGYTRYGSSPSSVNVSVSTNATAQNGNKIIAKEPLSTPDLVAQGETKNSRFNIHRRSTSRNQNKLAKKKHDKTNERLERKRPSSQNVTKKTKPCASHPSETRSRFAAGIDKGNTGHGEPSPSSAPLATGRPNRCPMRQKISSWSFINDSNDGDRNGDALARKKKPTVAKPKRKRRSSIRSSGDKWDRNFGNKEDDGNDDGMKPTALEESVSYRYPKRQRSSKLLHAAPAVDKKNEGDTKNGDDIERKTVELVESLSRRYPKRKAAPKTSKNDSDRYGDDDDVDDDEEVDHNCNIGDDKKRYKKYRNRKALDNHDSDEDYSQDVETDCGDSNDKVWNVRFRELLAHFREQNSFIGITNKRLQLWIKQQRTVYIQQEMHPNRIRRMESIKFMWQPQKKISWVASFKKLVAFKEKYGHVNVIKRYKEDPKLGLWCRHQRYRYNHEPYNMDRERIVLMESIGFRWCVRESNFATQYNELIDFKKKHGHFIVPSDNVNLARWVLLRRKEFARNTIPPSYRSQLDEINFTWEIETE